MSQKTIDHFDKRRLDIFGVRFIIIQQEIQVDVFHAGDTIFFSLPNPSL
jgi:hypothetical protein